MSQGRNKNLQLHDSIYPIKIQYIITKKNIVNDTQILVLLYYSNFITPVSLGVAGL